MRKKIFAALLTAVLVAGCSSENDEPEARQTPSPTPDPARHISNYTYVPSFFTDMWKSRQFVSQVKARWKEISPRIMSEFWPEARRYAICAAEAMGRNAERWPIGKYYQTEIDRMEKWLQLRTAFMDQLVANYPAGN